MENASKALIIAGAILISILLISVGIMVMSSTNGVQEEMGASMSSAQVQSYNTQFSNYIGQHKSASEVKALFEKVQATNASNVNKMFMEIKVGSTTSTASPATIATLNTGKKYKIVISDVGSDATSNTKATNDSKPDGIYDYILVEQEN